MKLNLAERLTLLDMLPKEESLVMMKIMHNLRMDLSLSEGEMDETGLRMIPVPGNPEIGQWVWDNEGIPKDVNIGYKARGAIVALLEALDTNGKIEERHLSLCEKFGVGED